MCLVPLGHVYLCMKCRDAIYFVTKTALLLCFVIHNSTIDHQHTYTSTHTCLARLVSLPPSPLSLSALTRNFLLRYLHLRKSCCVSVHMIDGVSVISPMNEWTLYVDVIAMNAYVSESLVSHEQKQTGEREKWKKTISIFLINAKFQIQINTICVLVSLHLRIFDGIFCSLQLSLSHTFTFVLLAWSERKGKRKTQKKRLLMIYEHLIAVKSYYFCF